LGADTFSCADCADLGTLIVQTGGSEGDRRGQMVGLGFGASNTRSFDDEERAVR